MVTISRGHLFLAVFFRVTHDELSERWATRDVAYPPLSVQTTIGRRNLFSFRSVRRFP